MMQDGVEIQENSKCFLSGQKRIGLALLGVSLLFFLFAGERGYVWFRDSSSYVKADLDQGVMWIYPLLLNLLRVVFGESNYLNIAAVVQSAFAAISVTAFAVYIGRTFQLKTWEYFLIWTATLLPYSTELPGYLITHSIQTESITFSLFYWYAVFAINVLQHASFRAMVGMYGFAFLMANTRPQLNLLYGLSGLLLIYCIVVKGSGSRWRRFLIGFLFCGVLSALGLLTTYKIRAVYMNVVTPIFAGDENIISGEENTDSEPDDQIVKAPEQEIERKRSFILPDQLGSAVICRTFYLADREDELAFEDKDERAAFARIYESADAQQQLYCYAQTGLKMWTDIAQNKLYTIAGREISAYLDETYPEMSGAQRQVRASEIRTGIALTELSLHFGRFCYMSFRLMIPGWIACVFFNIYGIYLFCHIFVLFLYLSAMGMAIWMIRRVPEHRLEAKVLLASVCSCILFVVIVNIIFFGMQRYFIYNMGVFWTAYYLNFRIVVPHIWRRASWKS